jgi:glycolate oxidase iron-sulfur subunit
METRLTPESQARYGQSALLDNLRRCVHCGFCNATCPTYQLWGDELDGPRGRLYQIKQAVEGHVVGTALVTHLDRCLTCRACESTCPSGVEYAKVLDIGREFIERNHLRSPWSRAIRLALVVFLDQRVLIHALVRLGRWLGVVPTYPVKVTTDAGVARKPNQALPKQAPPRPAAGVESGTRPLSTRVVFIKPCVQDTLAAGIDASARRVIEHLGARVLQLANSGCCGALAQHLSAPARAAEQARRNIDAWWPELSHSDAQIVVTASGCAAHVKEYAHLLKDDLVYAPRAQQVSARCLDLSEWVAKSWPPSWGVRASETIAVQSPCSLQHGQKLKGQLEAFLQRIGLVVAPVPDGHLCCGSAGSYSLLNPATAQELRARKLSALASVNPAVILTANIGCYHHLKPASTIPVWHWIQWLDAKLALNQ